MPFPSPTPGSMSGESNRRSRGTNNGIVNFYEENAEYIVEIEIPGYDRDNITTTWHEGRLTVSVSQAGEKTGQNRTFHRTFWVPKEVNADDISARYRNGVLTVTLPITEDHTTYGDEIEIM
jgi:HSP20 family protein